MSSAPRETKCWMPSNSLAGQETLVQTWAASSGARTTSQPQTGHAAGMWNSGGSACPRSVTTRTTWGITSPARSTTTESPTRMSLVRM